VLLKSTNVTNFDYNLGEGRRNVEKKNQSIPRVPKENENDTI